MNSEDGQVYYVCILQLSCFTKYNRMQSKHKQTKCEHRRRNSYKLQLPVNLEQSEEKVKRRYAPPPLQQFAFHHVALRAL